MSVSICLGLRGSETVTSPPGREGSLGHISLNIDLVPEFLWPCAP